MISRVHLYGFRAIVEFSTFDSQNYYAIQVCRPGNTKPETSEDVLRKTDDFSFYTFGRFPLDGFQIAGVSFNEIRPLLEHLRKQGAELKSIQKRYSQEIIPLDIFLSAECISLGREAALPKKSYPAYEPVISIVELEPERYGGIEKAASYSTEIQIERIKEYLAMLSALGYHAGSKAEEGSWQNEVLQAWIQRNAKVHRLSNPIANGKLGIGDIKYCEPHYWHFVGGTRFVRKFYVAEKKINTLSLKERIAEIRKEKCPDALDHIVEREGGILSKTTHQRWVA